MFKFTISSEKIIYASKVVAAIGVIFGAIGYTFGFEIPSIATSAHTTENRLLITQNFWEDYDRDLKSLKRDRRDIRQQIFELEQTGQPVSPLILEDQQEIDEEIEEIKSKKKQLEEEIKALENA